MYPRWGTHGDAGRGGICGVGIEFNRAIVWLVHGPTGGKTEKQIKQIKKRGYRATMMRDRGGMVWGSP